MVLSIPAMKSLWSMHDIDLGHKRRYSKESIKEVLESAGFEIVEIKYFFISIIPLLYIRKLLNPIKNEPPKGDTIPKINAILNKILIAILRLENKLISYLPNFIGGSLLVVGRKRV